MRLSSRRLRVLVCAGVAASLVPATPSVAADLTPVRVPNPAPRVQFAGSGWGHSAGMSQYGAYAMAQAGKGYRQIVHHYYQNVAFDTRPNPFVTVRLGDFNWANHGFVISASPSNGERVPWRVRKEGHWSTFARQRAGHRFEVTRDGAQWKVRDVDSSCSGATCDVVFEERLGTNDVIAVRQAHVGGVVQAPDDGKGTDFSDSNWVDTYRWGQLRLGDTPGTPHKVRTSVRLKLEKYLRGLGEVPSCWPTPALKAQVVTARSYAYHKGRHSLSSTTSDQVYVGYSKEKGLCGGRWVNAVDGTSGEVLTHGGKPIMAVYSSSHNTRTENSEDSWAYSAALPYLRSVKDPWSRVPTGNRYRSWSRSTTNSNMAKIFRMDRVLRIRILDRTDGRSPRTLRVWGVEDGKRTTIDYSGNKDVAGASLLSHSRLGYGSSSRLLPSQQMRRIGLAPFRDDDGMSHEPFIARIEAAGITNSCNSSGGGDRYCPNRRLTRAEMATFLVRSFKELSGKGGNRFSDVAWGSSHRTNINAIYDAGLTKSCNSASGGDRYCPKRKVTRAEMATFLVRAVEGLDPKGGNRFDDVSWGSSHRRNINAIADAGITTGCGSGNDFCPDRAVTRAEMAVFLVRALTWRP